MPRHKDGGNCEEVIGELSSIIRGTVSRTVNHEFCPSALKDGLHEVDAETTQSVTVHDHNFFDQVAEHGVQKGNKAFPFKVDAAANVGDDFVIGEGFLKVFLLTSEVLALMRRRHADVDDSTFGLRGRLSTLVSEEFSQMSEVVQTLAFSSLKPDMSKRAVVRPHAESLLVDVVYVLDHPARHECRFMVTFGHAVVRACLKNQDHGCLILKNSL